MSIVPADPTNYQLLSGIAATYQTSSTGLSTTVGRRLSDYTRVSLGVNIQQVQANASVPFPYYFPTQQNVNPIALASSDPISGSNSASAAIGVTAPSLAQIDSTKPYALHSLVFGVGSDTRDDIQNPRSGFNISLQDEFSSTKIGSAFNYSQYTLDAARFFPILKRATIGVHGAYGITTGAIPTNKLYTFSDQELRGYTNPFYGTNKALVQAELRYPLTADRKFGIVLFADDGATRIAGGQQINSDNSTTDLNKFVWHADVGIGVRFDVPQLGLKHCVSTSPKEVSARTSLSVLDRLSKHDEQLTHRPPSCRARRVARRVHGRSRGACRGYERHRLRRSSAAVGAAAVRRGETSARRVRSGSAAPVSDESAQRLSGRAATLERRIPAEDCRAPASHARPDFRARASGDRIGRIEQESLGRGRQTDHDRGRSRHHANVRDLLSGAGDPVPPVNTPPPSTVGYVDQTQIDALPSIKSATDEFVKFKATQDQAAAAKFKAAKTQADRDAIMKDYQKTLSDKQTAVLKPLVDKTKSAIASVAQSKGLVLVIDRGNIIYGGTDITADVTSKLK